MHKDWHDHQKQVQDKLKAEIANKEATISDLLRLNESYADKLHLLNRICAKKQATEEDLLRLNEKYADEMAMLKKEKELNKAQHSNYLLHFIFAVCFIFSAYNAYDMSQEIEKLKSENKALKEKPIGERRQA